MRPEAVALVRALEIVVADEAIQVTLGSPWAVLLETHEALVAGLDPMRSHTPRTPLGLISVPLRRSSFETRWGPWVAEVRA